MNGIGALCVGVIASSVVWIAWTYVSKLKPFSLVDDALGVTYTHGFAGLTGGLLVGILADPKMVEYGINGVQELRGSGQLPRGRMVLWPLVPSTLGTVPRGPLWIIGWTAVGTFIVFTVVKFLCGGLRESDEMLREGDLAIHDEEAFPEPTFGEPLESPSHVHSDNL